MNIVSQHQLTNNSSLSSVVTEKTRDAINYTIWKVVKHKSGRKSFPTMRQMYTFLSLIVVRRRVHHAPSSRSCRLSSASRHSISSPTITQLLYLACAPVSLVVLSRLRRSLCVCIAFTDVLIYSAAKAASVFNKLTLLYFTLLTISNFVTVSLRLSYTV